MTDYQIQPGDTLSKIAQKYGVTVQQLKQANDIDNENLIFAGSTIKIPIESDKAFEQMDGWSLSRLPKGDVRTVYSVINPGKGDNPVLEEPIQHKVVPLYGVANPGCGKDDGSTPVKNEPLPHKVVPLYGVANPGGGGDDGCTPAPNQPTEPKNPDQIDMRQWQDMICHDDSGKTSDITGKIGGIETGEKIPKSFTITDVSSGSEHVYKYELIGEDDNGRPIYKCVSMNDFEVITENQYTLELRDGKPALIQHDRQDNYGRGLRFGTRLRPGTTTPGTTTPGTTTPGTTTPGTTTPGTTTPGATTPGATTPGTTTPGTTTPGVTTPGTTTPGTTTPGATTPGTTTPGTTTPGTDPVYTPPGITIINNNDNNIIIIIDNGDDSSAIIVDPGKVDPGKDDPDKDEPGKVNPGKEDPGKDDKHKKLTDSEIKLAKSYGSDVSDYLVGYTSDSEEGLIKNIVTDDSKVNERNVLEFLRGYEEDRGSGDHFFDQVESEYAFGNDNWNKQDLMINIAQKLQKYLEAIGANADAGEIKSIIEDGEVSNKEADRLDEIVAKYLKGDDKVELGDDEATSAAAAREANGYGSDLSDYLNGYTSDDEEGLIKEIVTNEKKLNDKNVLEVLRGYEDDRGFGSDSFFLQAIREYSFGNDNWDEQSLAYTVAVRLHNNLVLRGQSEDANSIKEIISDGKITESEAIQLDNIVKKYLSND